MGKFTALPQPLRWVMGLRAGILDQALKHHPLRGQSFQLIPSGALLDPEYLASDGYHPSESGYFAWGKNIASMIAEYDRQRDQEDFKKVKL